MEMMTLDEAAIRPLIEEGLLPGISVWGASFSPFEGTTECVAFRLLGWSGRTALQIGATEAIDFTKTIPAWEYEEDGEICHEPEVRQEHSFRFLRIEPLDSRAIESAAMHQISMNPIEGMDLLYATYEIPFPEGTESRRVVAGIHVRVKEYPGKQENSFAILQERPHAKIAIGPASKLLGNLPSHFEGRR